MRDGSIRRRRLPGLPEQHASHQRQRQHAEQQHAPQQHQALLMLLLFSRDGMLPMASETPSSSDDMELVTWLVVLDPKS